MDYFHAPDGVSYQFHALPTVAPAPPIVDFQQRDVRRLGSRIGFSLSLLNLIAIVGMVLVMLLIPNLFLLPGGVLVGNELAYAVGGGFMYLMLRKFPSADITAVERPGSRLIWWSFGCLGVTQLFAYLTQLLKLFLTSSTNLPWKETSDLLTDTDLGILGFISMVILAPIIEELIFRELLYRKLILLGTRPYILFSALLFGMFHGNLDQMFYAIVVGIFLGYLRCRFGSWKYCAISHGVVNFFGGGAALLLQSEQALTSLGLFTLLFSVIGLIYLIGVGRQWLPALKRQADRPVKLRWLLTSGGMLVFTGVVLLMCFFIFNL